MLLPAKHPVPGVLPEYGANPTSYALWQPNYGVDVALKRCSVRSYCGRDALRATCLSPCWQDDVCVATWHAKSLSISFFGVTWSP